jgi:2'-5' RNA ligase
MRENCKKPVEEKGLAESIRSFLAFDIENDAVKSKLAEVQGLLTGTGADLKLVEIENIHITMRFLGNVTSRLVEQIYEEMKKVHFTTFDVQIMGLGAFPDIRYPRVIWAGISEGVDNLKNVFSQLEPRLRQLGFTPDSRGFSAHLTIARVRSGRNKAQLASFLTENGDFNFGKVEVHCLRLKKSDLSQRGPVYSTLKEFCPSL